MKFDLVITQQTQGVQWQVHIHGCEDAMKFRNLWTVDAESPEEAIQKELDFGEKSYRKDGWTEADFQIMSCAESRPSELKPPLVSGAAKKIINIGAFRRHQ